VLFDHAFGSIGFILCGHNQFYFASMVGDSRNTNGIGAPNVLTLADDGSPNDYQSATG
jgi:hypothetical protein